MHHLGVPVVTPMLKAIYPKVVDGQKVSDFNWALAELKREFSNPAVVENALGLQFGFAPVTGAQFMTFQSLHEFRLPTRDGGLLYVHFSFTAAGYIAGRTRIVLLASHSNFQVRSIHSAHAPPTRNRVHPGP